MTNGHEDQLTLTIEGLVDELGCDPEMFSELLRPGGPAFESLTGRAAEDDPATLACLALRQAGVWGGPAFEVHIDHPLFGAAVEAARAAIPNERRAIEAALAVLAGANVSPAEVFDPVIEDTCRVCGCSDYDACVDVDQGPCGWAAPSLCNSHRARDLVWALWQLFMRRLRRRR